MPDIRDATWDDLDAVFELLEARSRAAFGSSQLERKHVRQSWEVPGGRRWVAVEDGAIVGYAALEESHDVGHAAVDPDVGDALLAHVEQEARRRGFDHVSVTAVPEDEPLYNAVLRNGYALERETLRMWRGLDGDLPEPRWPDGVTVRTYDDADGRRVHALLDDVYAGWDDEYVARSHEGWLSFMTEHDEFDPAMWFLVERDGELVACALHWKVHQRRGWVKDIVVVERERGKGLAKALLHHGFRAYAVRGAERVGLKVDSNNPTGAPELYERIGFEIDQRLGIWQKRL
ncbi:MAG: GNAT family N-acetyltransferase [Gaiellaceae bacterium]